ncbi:MAG TPA: 5-amino-6-(D-ribitylamino)uracil--L-tyrosine 4-hydroxyphenyl transferase CofH [Candidatus Deferrimicrobium sp.]|nr:5-amino-6-(D-ribitylamino)uracil--L-tyrosine 4-hydroxyphenyl transferase CofH [Candidatus Deferrimicrobium sp.]
MKKQSDTIRNLEKFLDAIDPETASILNRFLDGKKNLKGTEAIELFHTTGLEFQALLFIADFIQKQVNKDVVTFVINRNINFTNICTSNCQFCSFSVKPSASDAFFLEDAEILKRAKEAVKIGATEVCIQGGLAPNLNIYSYSHIIELLKQELPNLHIHGFSPMEVYYGSRNSDISIQEGLRILKEAGLDSMPGTAAEILVDEIRKKICPNKMDVANWVKTIKTAHNLGIPTSSTIMYGHIDSIEDRVKHLEILRDIQKETHGFTEFVPLSFMYWNTKIFKEGIAMPGSTGMDDLKMYAISRLFFHGLINNIQVSWVKLGPKLAQIALNVGCNDFGGTLMDENISKSAGASFGEYLPPSEFIHLIKDAGRIPAQRDTVYKILKNFT